MITVREGQLGINKASIANIIAVSRSAVTQSSKKQTSTDQDFIHRVYRYLSRVSKNKNTLQLHINDVMVYLLQDVRDEVQRRSAVRTSAGRKCTKINFTELKRVIRAVVSELLSSIVTCNSVSNQSISSQVETQVSESGAVSISQNVAGIGFGFY